MKTVSLPIKPLSINSCRQGRRFKTQAYKKYRTLVVSLLPSLDIQPKRRLHLQVEFGFSSVASDIDNPLKPFLDCFQDKYGIDDKWIYELKVAKMIVKKGDEYIRFKIAYI